MASVPWWVSEARPATTVAEMSADEIREWAANLYEAPDARSHRGARLEVVRVLREQCYATLNRPFDVPGFEPQVELAAQTILDTPVDKLAAMVVMSDTVMGNWRTIAATLVS